MVLGDFMRRKQDDDYIWYKFLFDNLNEAAIRFDKNQQIIEANHQFEQLFHFNSDEIIGKKIDEVFDSVIEDIADRNLTKKLLNGQSIKTEGIRYAKDKTPVYCIIHGVPIILEGELLGGYAMYMDISELRETKKMLQKEKIKYSELVEEMGEGLVLHNADETFVYVNSAASEIFDMSKEELIGKTIKDFIVEEDYSFIDHQTSRRVKNKKDRYNLRIITPKGEEKIINVKARPIWTDLPDEPIKIYAVFSDITEQYEVQERIRKSEAKYRSLVDSMDEGLCLCRIIVDENEEPSDFEILETNPKYEMLMSKNRVNLIGSKGSDVLKDYFYDYLGYYKKCLKKDGNKTFKKFDKNLNKYFKISIFSAKKNQFGVLLEDVTVEEEAKNQIKYLSYHDKLTGLYNRAYLEEEIQKLNLQTGLTVGVIMGDANGLKLINDIYGHDKGDELLISVAKILKENVTQNAKVIRLGGDEFIVLVTHTTPRDLEHLLESISNAFENKYITDIPISISLGSSISNVIEKEVTELIKEAESQMYEEKIHKSKKIKRQLLNSLIEKLYKKQYETDEMLELKKNLALRFGNALKLDFVELEKLKELIKIYDIGKAIIPKNILFKKEQLSKEEQNIIKKHPVTSYRILKSTHEYSYISNEVLHHHEWWNGEGYPAKLQGEEIPLLSRIVAIIEYYIALINDRPYRPRVSQGTAIDELRNQSGRQLDPFLTDLFITQIIQKNV